MVLIAAYITEPSMLTVAPSGSIKRLMRGSILLFSSTQRIVVGSVAALEIKKKVKNKINHICCSIESVNWRFVIQQVYRNIVLKWNRCPDAAGGKPWTTWSEKAGYTR